VPRKNGESSKDALRPVPEDFKFGVATSAFQVEGGLNGPGEPENNWASWERAGLVEPSGSAVGFWERYEEHLDRAAAMGCDVFRLGIEWARVEPEQGQIDTAVLDGYEQILRACSERGIEPFVTLHHFTHPAWLGEDFWLSSGSPELYESWVSLVVDRLGDRCRHWVTINELNILAFANYVIGIYPPGRKMAMGDFNRAMAHLLAAHVRGYEQIHARNPDAFVTTNNSATSLYEYDRLLVDMLLAPASGVVRDEVEDWIDERRSAWYEAIDPPSPLERLIRRASAASAPIARRPFASSFRRDVSKPSGRSAFDSALDAIYASPHPLTLDALAIDYYDPVASNHIRLPGHTTAGGRSMAPGGELWDESVNPSGLNRYLRANVEMSAQASGSVRGAESGSRPLPIWVVENGMCNRVRRGRSFDRLDGWDRPRFMREHMRAVVDALDAGLPVAAYLHWSLVDNYEWGSYEPRFGIHGVDRERNVRILDTDSMGKDSAGAYRELVKGLKAGDRSVLNEAR
jgi:beta-glucosidase